MRISARQIELFQMAYRLKSTRKAATAMHVSQPAISRAVSELETEIGVQLFDRSGRKFEPTVAANSLNDAILKHYHGLDRVIDAAQMIAEGITGHVRVVALPSVADGLVSRAAAQLMAKNLELRIDVDVMGERECLAALRSGNADCALVSSILNEVGLTCSTVTKIDPVVAVPPNDVLAKRAVVSMSDLADRDMVMLPTNSPFRLETDAAFKTAALSVKIRAEARTQSALMEYVAQGIGCAIIDPAAAKANSNAEVELRPLSGELSWPIQFVVGAAMYDAPVFQLLRKAMSAN